MPEDHHPDSRDQDSAGLDRRRFVKIGATSLGVAGLGACVFGFRYLSPNVLYEPSPIVSVGRPERYAVDSVILDPRFGISWCALQKASTPSARCVPTSGV